MTTQTTKPELYRVYHHSEGGRFTETEGRYATAAEALAACADANAAEEKGGGHFHTTDAACGRFRCRGVALTPDGLCADCVAADADAEQEDE